ncbi:MAG TPA: CBS domain-containing protein [bacterium]|nr:CBS domain-containing protein [bacterium]
MSARAADIMSREIEMVPEDMTVSDLATFLTDKEISGAPVVDKAGQLVGVVSTTDIVRCEADRTGSEGTSEPPAFFLTSQWRGMNREDYGGLTIRDEGLLVRNIMTPTVFTVTLETPIQQIARTMVAGRIHRLLVTEKEKVVGIITSLDLLKLLCE